MRRRLNKETDVGMYSFFVARPPSVRSLLRSLPYLQNVRPTPATEITPAETSPSPPCQDGRRQRREGRSDSVRILTDATTRAFGRTDGRATGWRRRRCERTRERTHHGHHHRSRRTSRVRCFVPGLFAAMLNQFGDHKCLVTYFRPQNKETA